MREFFTGRRIAQIGILSAMSLILILIRFPIPAIFPFFLELHFSDIPALIGGFAYGPVTGVIIVLVKNLLKLAVQGTNTAFVGDLADFLMGCAFVIPASLFYKYKRTKKGAIISLVIGAVSGVLVAVIANRFIMIPFYLTTMGLDLETLAGMSSVLPGITADNFFTIYLLYAVVPLNTIKCVVTAVLTFVLYKRLSTLINKIGEGVKSPNRHEYITKNEEDTLKIAQKYSKSLKPNDVVLLKGEMGVGKTVFAKGVAKGLGILQNVTSPTYAYMNDYDGKLYHYDCYRLSSGEEAKSMGLTDYFEAGGICLIEWSENISDVLPENCKKVEIVALDENRRRIVL